MEAIHGIALSEIKNTHLVRGAGEILVLEGQALHLQETLSITSDLILAKVVPEEGRAGASLFREAVAINGPDQTCRSEFLQLGKFRVRAKLAILS